MMAHSRFFSQMAKGLLVSIAMAALWLTWGCGGPPSQVVLDDEAKASIQKAHDRQRQFMEEKASKAKAKGGRLPVADSQPQRRGGR